MNVNIINIHPLIYTRYILYILRGIYFGFTFTFQLLDKLFSGVVLSPPRYSSTCLLFLSRIGFRVPTARRLSSNVANSRFRAFRESICAQNKVPTNLYEYALGGTHEIDLYSSSRHKDNLLRHRGEDQIRPLNFRLERWCRNVSQYSSPVDKFTNSSMLFRTTDLLLKMCVPMWYSFY